MGNIAFNISLGRIVYDMSLPGANDALIIIPIEASGIESDNTLRDYDDLGSILAAANNEQSTMGRKTVTSVTVTINDTDNRAEVDIADQTWTAAAGNAIAALIFAYDGDTTGGTDSNIRPLTKHDCSMTPDGSDFTSTITDFFRASSAA
ncbi:hypothetical protein GCM10009555_017500 [Acrocarpospora macrocephala]|uniref:Uncharacterized protein n=1 Tax=Acrocarpospora macrocephala TaxID=150177 RepID=A0A5M3WGJ5_9ACTN|nr:hypothetical protein [Acrocarpospora macrocephala]GES07410.1 hypothetical protein Amac_010050 [Acrocarpospora macrocephala]